MVDILGEVGMGFNVVEGTKFVRVQGLTGF